ncbi:hypothetical protein O6H91_01G058600 [Diphasiastrum complanatum]|uniref:Uncharacterized protein n=1 Tax=Diphasiastrum complanatum TaxID=34168 RepID=A0ACC2ERL7_DIPCM|nr:hypothetical protein O6H91_01G058600 [Diphasiastrum complanatum]
MDFSLGYAGASSGNVVGASERSLALMAAEVRHENSQQQQNMLPNFAMSPSTGAGMVGSSSLLFRCRPASELDPPSAADEHSGPLKLARTNSGSANVMSSGAFFLAGQSTPMRYPPPFQHDSYIQQHRPTSGVPLMMGREGLVHHVSMHEAAMGGRYLFTAAQWAELEHQALIYKYMMHGAPVPAELLLPIRKSLAAMSGIPLSSHSHGNAGWESFQRGVSVNVDPEPGRCRRTDGKKWRCSRPVVPEQKYCERHIHRGRHRKKAAQAQNTSPVPSPSTNAAPSPSAGKYICHSSSLAAETHHTLRPSSIPIASNHPQMINRNPAQNLTASGIAGGTISSGSMACNEFHLPLHSASSLPSSKDHRHGLQSHSVLSQFSSIDQPHRISHALPSNQQLSWHLQPPRVLSPSAALNPSSSFFLNQNSDHDMKCFQGDEEMAFMADTHEMDVFVCHQQQRQNGPSLCPIEALSDDSKPQGQPLRHFFDDWPRNRDSSALFWSDAEEEKPKIDASSPQLSISIPANSSEISASDGPTEGKNMFLPLRLSILRNADDIADPTQMGLGMGMGLGITSSSHGETSWFPRALENGVGGPLAEVLQSGTPHPEKITSLNFLKADWDSNVTNDTPHSASPTGVLQKTTLGTCFSDSSSNASSPGSVRTEYTTENQRLTPVLTNCSSRLST